MREIKFRAFDLTLNSWVVGWLLKDSIIDLFDFETIYEDIDINSIGQYTGLKDKNGKEIYEGDVIKVDKSSSNFDEDIAKVVFENGCFLLKTVEFEYDLTEHFIQDFNNRGWYEVIGNIYEENFNDCKKNKLKI